MRPQHRVLETPVGLVASLAIALAVAVQDVPAVRIGSCSAYSGLPGEAEPDGMTVVSNVFTQTMQSPFRAIRISTA
jgi:hypothetical protein